MTRYIIAVFAFIILIAVAVPVFAGISSDVNLNTSEGVEKFFSEEQQNSN